MADFLKPYLERSPANIILHVGANNSVNDSSNVILNKLLSLKNVIETELPESTVILSNIINRKIGQWYSMVKNIKLQQTPYSLKIDTIDNGNISSEHLNGSRPHLDRHGKRKLVMNLIKKLQQEKTEKTLIEIDNKLTTNSLTRPQYDVSNCVCNNDCKRKSDTACPKHILEIKHGSSLDDFHNTENQMKPSMK